LLNVWGNNVLLSAQDDRPTTKSLSFANTYVQNPGLQTVTIGKGQIGERAVLEKIQSVVGQTMEYDQVIRNVECGYLIIDAI